MTTKLYPKNGLVKFVKKQLEIPLAYKPERVLPKMAIGYYTFISRDGYIFRDGLNGQYIIVNKDKNINKEIEKKVVSIFLVERLKREKF